MRAKAEAAASCAKAMLEIVGDIPKAPSLDEGLKTAADDVTALVPKCKDVQARLEFNPANPDTDIEVANCDLFPPLNRHATGAETCDTFPSETFREVKPTFTGDATIRYDVNGDGKSSRTLQMRGTHRV